MSTVVGWCRFVINIIGFFFVFVFYCFTNAATLRSWQLTECSEQNLRGSDSSAYVETNVVFVLFCEQHLKLARPQYYNSSRILPVHENVDISSRPRSIPLPCMLLQLTRRSSGMARHDALSEKFPVQSVL